MKNAIVDTIQTDNLTSKNSYQLKNLVKPYPTESAVDRVIRTRSKSNHSSEIRSSNHLKEHSIGSKPNCYVVEHEGCNIDRELAYALLDTSSTDHQLHEIQKLPDKSCFSTSKLT